MIHEWFGYQFAASPSPSRRPVADGWLPPLTLLALLAANEPGLVLWIGRRCWPSVWTLAGLGGQGPEGLALRSVFIDPDTEHDRVWAVEQGLRCRAVGAVIADGSGLSMPATRRLQLAASMGGVLGLIARPPWEQRQLSAAASRWVVETHPAEARPAWVVRAVRCRARAVRGGTAAGPEGAAAWVVRAAREGMVVGDEARVSVRLVAGVVGGAFAPEQRRARFG